MNAVTHLTESHPCHANSPDRVRDDGFGSIGRRRAAAASSATSASTRAKSS